MKYQIINMKEFGIWTFFPGLFFYLVYVVLLFGFAVKTPTLAIPGIILMIIGVAAFQAKLAVEYEYAVEAEKEVEENK